jgi:peptidoglycan/LPS O-acetylase OafA/YrhL
MQQAADYRRDVDWLRAVAVVSVIGFHFEISGFRGGFVGVDVFFVISGFLIGRIVQSELLDKSFSFLAFYERRIRRLIPALYVMLVVSLLAGMDILSGTERSEFLRSITGVATFTANIFFWMQSGYFDRASSEKPLLHTWSLGVEEQFYILLPILLWLLLRLRGTPAMKRGVAALAVASLLVSQSLLSSADGSAFFLLQSRAWELLTGVLLVWIPSPRRPWVVHAARGLGLILIVTAILSYTPRTSFPGINALLPCAGAALFLIGGASAHRFAPLEQVGRMSYSLYLWHWPIYSFAKLKSVTLTVPVGEKLLLILLLAGAATASYLLIERPARTAPVRRGTVFASAACATVILLIAGALGSRVIGTTPQDASIAALQAYETYMEKRTGTCFSEDWPRNSHPECFVTKDTGQTLLLWGDSLADHYMAGLTSVAPSDVQVLQANAAACYPSFSKAIKQYEFCDSLANTVQSFIQSEPPALVIISADWLGYSKRLGFSTMVADLKSTIAAIGVPVVLIGPSVQFKGRLPSILTRAKLRGDGPPASLDIMAEGLTELDGDMMRAFRDVEALSYVSVLNAICPKGGCPLMIGHDIPLTWDHGHLTRAGSEYAAHELAGAIFAERVASP